MVRWLLLLSGASLAKLSAVSRTRLHEQYDTMCYKYFTLRKNMALYSIQKLAPADGTKHTYNKEPARG